MRKQYLSRHDSRRASLDSPVGDPFGGPAYGERRDPVTAIVGGAAANVVGGALGAREQRKGLEAGEDIEAARLAELSRQFDIQRADAERQRAELAKMQSPYMRAGRNALRQYRRGLTRQPDYAKIVRRIESDPGYQFELEQGQKAIEGSAAAGGMLRSGRTLTGLTQYAQDLARSKAGEAYMREYGAWQGRQAGLAGLMGIGQSAAGGIGYNPMLGAMNPALQDNTLAQLAMQQGQNRSDLITGLANTGTNVSQNMLLLNLLKGGGGGGGGGSLGYGGSGASANETYGVYG